MKQTPIYNFDQPEMTDKVSLKSIQENIDKIDSAIKESNDVNDAIVLSKYAKTAELDADKEDIEHFKETVKTDGFYLEKDLWNTLDYPREDKYGLLTSHAAYTLQSELDDVKALKFDLETELNKINTDGTLINGYLDEYTKIDLSKHYGVQYGTTCVIFPTEYNKYAYWYEGSTSKRRLIGQAEIKPVENLRDIKFFISEVNSGYMSGTFGFEDDTILTPFLQCSKVPYEPNIKIKVREGEKGFVRTNGSKTLYRNLSLNNALDDTTIFYIKNTITTLKTDWNKNTNINTIYLDDNITTYETGSLSGMTVFYVGTMQTFFKNTKLQAAINADGVSFNPNTNIKSSGLTDGFGAYNSSSEQLVSWDNLELTGLDLTASYEELTTWTMQALTTFSGDDFLYFNNNTTQEVIGLQVSYGAIKNEVNVNLDNSKIYGAITDYAQDKVNDCWYVVCGGKVLYTKNGQDFKDVSVSGFTNSGITLITSCRGNIYALSGTKISIIKNNNYTFSFVKSHTISGSFTPSLFLNNDVHAFLSGNTTNTNVAFYEIDEANGIKQGIISQGRHGTNPLIPVRAEDSNYISFVQGNLIIITNEFWITENRENQSIRSFLKILDVNSPNG